MLVSPTCNEPISLGWFPPHGSQDNAYDLRSVGAVADSLCRAALCQVFDSIYSKSPSISLPQARLAPRLTNSFLVDVPMSRVKFNVNTEYAYLQNFKILQS